MGYFFCVETVQTLDGLKKQTCLEKKLLFLIWMSMRYLMMIFLTNWCSIVNDTHETVQCDNQSRFFLFPLEKKKGFYSCLNYVTANAFMFEFYYFIKELHEQIVCTNPVVCQLLNFLMPIEKFLYDDEQSFEEVKRFFILH